MCDTKIKAHIPDGCLEQLLSTDKPSNGGASHGKTQLTELIAGVSEKCFDCKLCRKECRFLETYGNPKSMAKNYDPADRVEQSKPFECSLCGRCTAVCPVGIDPARMFLEMRREAVRSAGCEYPEHAVILGYEKRGTSRRYSYYALPQGCDTVFFPGCTLPGTRPQRVKDLYDHLRTSVPSLGIVLDCCTKPSHDLGRDDFFQSVFCEMKAYLLENGIRNVLVACPNCHKIFREWGRELSTRTVYEFLAEDGLPEIQNFSGSVTIHDPCAVRFETSIHGAVRHLAENTGLTVEEMAHHGKDTLCCGEGGAVGFIAPELAKNWCSLRKDEAQGRRIITYCAGCSNFLGQSTPTAHILDLLFEPEATLSGTVKVSRTPVTYWNRLRLKSWFKKNVNAPVTRERTFAENKAGKASIIPRILILMLIVTAIAAVHTTGAARFMDQETLRTWIEGFGIGGPLLYMLIYTIAPALFLPGLPITIAGGIIFGPFWGVIYTITSATMGACLAFLISRYLARHWVERKLRSPRWRKLDEEVSRHGWKVVAFTRLIPLFPFNLLNYAFGLTKIKFWHYAVTTLICMLPACVAFIVFSSSLLDIIRGKFSVTFLVGLLMVVLVSVLPILYQRRQSRKGREDH
jgi:uncharacterized membrane protein YdjX (TVP38/TMEM64 family)/Fe-S oxidoreductase